MKKLSMILDADGVLRNFTAGALVVVREVTGKTFSAADVTAFNFTKALGLSDDDAREVMKRITERRGFVTALPPYEKARQGVRRLRELGEVTCVTSPWEGPFGSNPWWRDESEAWLALHFGIDCVEHAHDKADFSGDLFVDDRSKNVRAWLSAHPHGCAVFWQTPHNTTEAVPAGSHATGSWDALYEIARDFARGPVQPTLPTMEAAQ
ncbi:MAG TPA: hypothetical protein VLE97_06085 [Gaiellaceae bacterium]|nr:hypothetical protein [Gaiellaceae bacterium]